MALQLGLEHWPDYSGIFVPFLSGMSWRLIAGAMGAFAIAASAVDVLSAGISEKADSDLV